LNVYEVSRSGDGYKIQTESSVRLGPIKTSEAVGTFIHITPRTDDERHFIEALKTGDPIAFKRRIVKTSMRNLVIKPAVLLMSNSLDRDASASGQVGGGAVASTTTNTAATSQAPLQGEAQQTQRLEDMTELTTTAGIVSIVPIVPGTTFGRRLMVKGAPITDGKGAPVEDDMMNFVRRFEGPSGEVIVISHSCSGSACGDLVLYRILIAKVGGVSISADFGADGVKPVIYGNAERVVVNFGAKGIAVVENGAIRLSKDLM
jgi:hypothetical protein